MHKTIEKFLLNKLSDKLLEEENLAKNERVRGAQLMAHFENLKTDFPDKIKDVRGKGLLTAFEMHDERMLDGLHVSTELLKNGIYAKETHHSTVRIAPALTVEAYHIDQMADDIRDVISKL